MPVHSTRGPLDEQLDAIGQGHLGRVLSAALDSEMDQRIVWVPDVAMANLPVYAIRVNGQYLIESHEVCYAPSGAWLRLDRTWKDV